MDKNLELINYSAFKFIEGIQNVITTLCTPLFSLGITRFRYTKIYSDGTYLSLDTSNEFIRQYLSVIENLGFTFNKEVNSIKKFNDKIFYPGCDINRFDKNKDPIIHLLYNNDLWNNLYVLMSDNDDFVEIISFSMTRKDIDASSFYLNNIKLLERFIRYFKEKTSNFITVKDYNKLAHFADKFTFGSLIDHSLEERSKKFLHEIRKKDFTLRSKSEFQILAPREVECLEHLVLGSSVKEIANNLNLSPRTIEFYINKAKKKTGYSIRQQLINKFIDEKISRSI